LKKVLLAALDEFLESLGFDFAQELRATTVRLERFAEKQLADYQSGLIRNLQEINQDLSFSAFEVKHQQAIEFQDKDRSRVFSPSYYHLEVQGI